MQRGRKKDAKRDTPMERLGEAERGKEQRERKEAEKEKRRGRCAERIREEYRRGKEKKDG